MVFGDSPSFRGTLIHKIRTYILKINSLVLRSIPLSHPIFNWLVPVFYVLVLTFCFSQFFTKTWTLVPDSIKHSNWHLMAILLSILSVYGSTAVCIWSDPGVIDKYNVNKANQRFHNNQIIFFDNNVCSTCKLEKPARSKHCSTCGRCIMLFDHHCIWINNCVGYYNYRYFLWWLLCNINFMVYGNYIMMQIIPPLQLFAYIKQSDELKITGAFMILCTIFPVVVVVFSGLQFRYMYLGITTNELDKWGEIEYLVRIGTLYYNGQQYLELVDGSFINMQGVVVLGQGAVKVETLEEVNNEYDRGFWNNLIERVMPEAI